MIFLKSATKPFNCSEQSCGVNPPCDILFLTPKTATISETVSVLEGAMTLLLVKYAATAFVIVLVSEIAKKADKWGALIASLPFVTIMVMIWLYLEKQDSQKIGSHSYYTFWYVLPTLPMFLVMPWLMAKGVHFWLALVICVVLTFGCFIFTVWAAKVQFKTLIFADIC